MRLSSTLAMYLGRQFLLGIGLVLLIMGLLILLFDVVELSRRAASRPNVTLGVIVGMALLHLPTLAQKVLPFAVMLGGMLTFSRLTRSHELVVVRAAGISVWQFLMPALIIAALIGVGATTVFNPVGSAMGAKYEQLENRYLKRRPSLLSVKSSGLWLRQAEESGQSVIHGARVSGNGAEFSDVTIYLFRDEDRFVGRIDAETATLRSGTWLLENVLFTAPGEQARHHDRYVLDTTLTIGQIQDSFAPPETMSFWALPGFISTLTEAGFSAVHHRLHWHSLLVTPLFLCAMVLIAATFSLRLTRRGGTGLLMVGGLLTGFALYVLTDVVFALGMSSSIPVLLAAWTPTGFSLSLGLAMLFHLEDG